MKLIEKIEKNGKVRIYLCGIRIWKSKKKTSLNPKGVYKQFQILKKEEDTSRGFSFNWKDKFLCLNDATSQTSFEPHDTYHVSWAIRKILNNNPQEHVDFSSSLQFCAHLSASIPVKFYDYRPATLKLTQLECLSADLTNLSIADKSIQSLSCMHVVEHIGLGRYGDSLDYNGDLTAIAELKRILAVDGILYFVVPIGTTARIQFNAHRIYSYEQIISYFSDLDLVEFSIIPDNAVELGMVENPDLEILPPQKFACGCFIFKRTK